MSPAIAFRVWGIDEMLTGPRLVSPFRYTVWHPGAPLEAACKDESHDRGGARLPKAHRREPGLSPPVPACSCGIYAYHDAEQMASALAAGLIGGAALCWGRITIHHEGIRAQYARPLALCVPETTIESGVPTSLVRLASRYGVPLLEPPNVALYAREFGESYAPVADPSAAWGARVAKKLFGRWFNA